MRNAQAADPRELDGTHAHRELSPSGAEDVAVEAREPWQRLVPDLRGSDPALRAAMKTALLAAEASCPVLVTGETGTGKELAARAIHLASDRRKGPLVIVNCAAMPEALLESELFGHARGAFTGAAGARMGRFGAADGGTLFLDEIGEMPIGVQAKLLRALQEGEIMRVGEDRPVRVNVRVIAATHRDLEALVAAGQFRADLLYRLDVVRVELPALRERRSDLGVLAAALLERANTRHRRSVFGISDDAMRALERYDWPGNIRELSNVIERGVVLRARGELTLEDLPTRFAAAHAAAVAAETVAAEALAAAALAAEALAAEALAAESRTAKAPRAAAPEASTVMECAAPARAVPSQIDPILPEEGLELRAEVERFESRLIDQALQRTGWNKNRAAALLGLQRTTLVEKLRRRGRAGEESGEHAIVPLVATRAAG